MKKIHLLLLLLIFSGVSASAYSPPRVRQDVIPCEIHNFLNKHFGKYEIEKIKYDQKDGECEVKYKNGITVEFKNNHWEEIESDYFPLPQSIIEILPPAAIRFIAKNYPRNPIREIKHKSYGYKVKLDHSYQLEFDHKGGIIEIDD